MTINEMRVELVVFCHGRANLEDPCENCPVNNIDNVCEDFNWYNTPENLVEKAYALAFREIKEEKTMTITPEAIRKLVLDALKEEELYASAVTDDNYIPRYEVGYIQGIVDFAEKVIGMIEEGYRVAMGATKSFTKEGDAE